MPRTSSTPNIAKPIQSGYDALYIARARRALPILTEFAVGGSTVTYGELAAQLDIARGRNLNFILGSIGATLDLVAVEAGDDVPLLQALVVNRATQLPGEGFESGGRALDKYESLKGSRRERFEEIWREALEYPHWHRVLRQLAIPVPEEGVVGIRRPDANPAKSETTRMRKERVGQCIFKWRVERIEKRCRVTGVQSRIHLRASHMKPWARCDEGEHHDQYNGLLLAPHIDHLFDRGYITFGDDGRLLISGKCAKEVVSAWKLRNGQLTGKFHPSQLRYLRYHREHIFKKA